MCGVFCIFLHRPLAEADVALGRAGTGALAHRGPDGQGEWIDRKAGAFLGHRRLAIIDPTPSSAQPMDLNGLVLSYNGEIYNFREVREQLQKMGLRFTTEGDVEVLLRAWQTWDEESLDRLDGMFAFAVWDGISAHLVTDPFGEKPLYYAETNEGLYVSSEIAPLAQLLGLEPSLEGETLAAYLSLGFVPPPATAYPTIKRLGAAKLVSVRNGQIASTKTYWTPPVAAPGSGPTRPLTESGLDVLQGALVDSLKARLYADVPLCMFLSRGIDSSLVTAMVKRDHGVDLKCLTMSYAGAGSEDEAPAASEIAKHIGVDHEVIAVGKDLVSVDPDSVIEIFGQPNESLTALLVKMMCTAATGEFKTGLTGVGGDEAFFGYGKNAFFYDMRFLYEIPQPLRRILYSMVRPFAHVSPRMMRLAYDILAPSEEQYIANKNFPAIQWFRKLDGFTPWARRTFPGRDVLEHAYRKFELDTVLPGSRVVTFDHASMAVGLELRTPFLSRTLVETVATFDPRAFIAYGQKSVLRRILARYLPDHLFAFPKSGFTFPQSKFVEGHGQRLRRIPSVPEELLEEAIRYKDEPGGWGRLAIRLISLDTFLRSRAVAAGSDAAVLEPSLH